MPVPVTRWSHGGGRRGPRRLPKPAPMRPVSQCTPASRMFGAVLPSGEQLSLSRSHQHRWQSSHVVTAPLEAASTGHLDRASSAEVPHTTLQHPWLFAARHFGEGPQGWGGLPRTDNLRGVRGTTRVTTPHWWAHEDRAAPGVIRPCVHPLGMRCTNWGRGVVGGPSRNCVRSLRTSGSPVLAGLCHQWGRRHRLGRLTSTAAECLRGTCDGRSESTARAVFR